MNTHADKAQGNAVQSQSVANEPAQKQGSGEAAFQFVDNRPEAVQMQKLQEMVNNNPRAAQLKAFQEMADNSPQAKQIAQLQAVAHNHAAKQQQPIQKKSKIPRESGENNTGLPDNLKSGIENLSGYSLDDVKVHYNSDKPAQLNAHAYAQGTAIHVAPGQEKHLPHEAWHVVQQKQGRVKPTIQAQGININDDAGLEKEADVMGGKALQMKVMEENDQPAMGNTLQKRNASDIGVGPIHILPKSQDHYMLNSINKEMSKDTIPLGETQEIAQKNEIIQLASSTLIVDDTGTIQEGQIGKTQFLSYMESQLSILGKQILEPVGLAQADCPDLNYWINYYRDKDAAYIEQAMKRYAPSAAGAETWIDFTAAIRLRVMQGLIENIKTGSSEVDPEPVPEPIEKERPRLSEIAQLVEDPLQLRICGRDEVVEEEREDPYSARLFTDQRHTMTKGEGKPVMVYGMMTCGAGIAISGDRVFVHHIPSGHTQSFINAMRANIGAVDKIVMMISNSSLDLESLKKSFAYDVEQINQQASNVEILYITGGSITVNNNGEYNLTGTKLLGRE